MSEVLTEDAVSLIEEDNRRAWLVAGQRTFSRDIERLIESHRSLRTALSGALARVAVLEEALKAAPSQGQLENELLNAQFTETLYGYWWSGKRADALRFSSPTPGEAWRAMEEALEVEEDVQGAASGCGDCDGGEYCEVHIERAITSAKKRRAALVLARQVMGPS